MKLLRDKKNSARPPRARRRRRRGARLGAAILDASVDAERRGVLPLAGARVDLPPPDADDELSFVLTVVSSTVVHSPMRSPELGLSAKAKNPRKVVAMSGIMMDVTYVSASRVISSSYLCPRAWRGGGGVQRERNMKRRGTERSLTPART